MKFTFILIPLSTLLFTCCQSNESPNNTLTEPLNSSTIETEVSNRIVIERSNLFENYTAEKIAVADFIEEYMNIMYDSSRSHRNSFWNSNILTEQQDRFLKESLPKEFHIAYPPRLLGIQELDQAEFIASISLGKEKFPFKVIQLKIAKDGLGRFYFIDLFSENLEKYKLIESQKNKYYYSPNVERNEALEKKNDAYNIQLAEFFEVNPFPITVVVLKDLKDYCDVLSYVYSPVITYDNQTGGIAIPEEKIVLAANNSPYYPHELVHLYNSKYKSHYWFDEGLATYLGGSVGFPLEYHLKKIANIDSLDYSAIPENQKIDDDTNVKYTLGGLFCKLAMDEFGGKTALLKLLSYGNTDEEFYAALREVFSIGKEEINSFVKEHLKPYANSFDKR